MPYGYLTQEGYKGKVSENCWMLFDTEQEYLNYIEEKGEN